MPKNFPFDPISFYPLQRWERRHAITGLGACTESHRHISIVVQTTVDQIRPNHYANIVISLRRTSSSKESSRDAMYPEIPFLFSDFSQPPPPPNSSIPSDDRMELSPFARVRSCRCIVSHVAAFIQASPRHAGYRVSPQDSDRPTCMHCLVLNRAKARHALACRCTPPLEFTAGMIPATTANNLTTTGFARASSTFFILVTSSRSPPFAIAVTANLVGATVSTRSLTPSR